MNQSQTTPTQDQQFEISIGGEQSGTFLNGYITANYKDIVKLLGKPQDNDGYKVDANWVFNINGKTVTLYNYKDGKNYNGKEGIATTKITNWHVGGNGNIEAEATYLAKCLNSNFRQTY